MPCHAGGDAGLPFLVEYARAHRADAWLPATGERADAARRFESVHDWHLHVHQHEVVVAPLHRFNGRLAVGGGVGGASERRQHLHGDLLIERSEEHTSELQSLMRISYAVFCLKKK